MELLNLIYQPTAAYIDPSTTTILISSITGVAVAIGATVTILLRKAKKKLHLDELSNKEVEEEIVISEDNEENK